MRNLTNDQVAMVAGGLTLGYDSNNVDTSSLSTSCRNSLNSQTSYSTAYSSTYSSGSRSRVYWGALTNALSGCNEADLKSIIGNLAWD